MKNQLIVLPEGKDIVDVVAGEHWHISDINIFRECKTKFAPSQKFTGDKAYQGEPQITTPQKKPKGVSLTLSQQKNNKQLSKTRIVVEHIIRVVKIFKVAGERFRLDCKNYERVILAICSLARLRINALILTNWNAARQKVNYKCAIPIESIVANFQCLQAWLYVKKWLMCRDGISA